jgi:hypothetical protein
MPTCYRNPWHKERDPESRACFETDAKPMEYRGYLIYNRVPGKPGCGVWDVVKDGVCVSQLAGPNGARRAIDELLDGE